MITNSADEAAHCKSLLEELIRPVMMHGGSSRQVDLLDPIIDKEISHQDDSSGGLGAEDKGNISNVYMDFISDFSGTIHDLRKLPCHSKNRNVSSNAREAEAGDAVTMSTARTRHDNMDVVGP